MPELPLLRLPNPNPAELPGGQRSISNLRKPSKGRQRDRFGPVFDRLQTVLSRAGEPIELRDDPTALAPERVIVFEIGGTVANFLKAIQKIGGFEFMAEIDTDFAADEDFAIKYGEGDKKGQDIPGKEVSGRYYLAMPDLQALRELLSLWQRWQNDEPLGRGLTPIGHLFAQLHDLRPWGMQDRIPTETIAFWREERERDPQRPVRTEIELWYRASEARRTETTAAVQAAVVESGGRVVQVATIADIAYHGLLVDIPSAYVQDLIELRAVKLAVADEVMFLRPQSILRDPLEMEAMPDGTLAVTQPGTALALGAPVVALLDGMPVQAHALLANRLIIDDPDDLESRALVSQRVHGTAMASLILHGDRNEQGEGLPRSVYVRPLMITNEHGIEQTENDRLLIDTIHRAILRIKGTESQEGVAPTVFMINLSMGDIRRPFSGVMSPLARLLDFLADKYGLLFIVSAGNILSPLEIADFTNWTAFEQARPEERERAVIKSLNNAKHERTILSPAEALNVLTIGAQHSDSVADRQGAHNAIDPLQDTTLPNITSALGLGYRRMIKPELYFPGGREYVRMQTTGEILRVVHSLPRRIYGLSSAAPDAQGQGRLDQVALTAGTSPATALATRAGARIFDSLMDRNGGSLLADIDPQYFAVVVKALLLHSARWSDNSELLKEICGPEDRRRHVERADNCARFVGYGVPVVERTLECSPNRATLVGYGVLATETAHSYLIPLPACLERVTDPRSLSITLAWTSPIKPGHQSYRSVKMEAAPDSPQQILGVERGKSQPADPTGRRGSVFHEHFEGDSAVAFIDDGHLALRVWCKQDAGAPDGAMVRYGIAVTIEAGTHLAVYEEVQQRLRIRPRP
jgi:Subtilase family